MTLIHRIDKALFGLVSVVAQALLWLAVATGFFQVVSRFVLHSPLDWSEVLTRAAIIWAVMLGVALAFRQGSMIAVEFLREKLRGKAKCLLEGIVNLTCIGFLVFLAWMGGQMTYRVRFQSVAGLEVSISWVYLAIPVGAGLAALALLLRWLTPDAPASQAPVRNDAQG
ncbi:TRAP transporter small permease [Lampropedia puyangensis]|uniref:TRAP transporter small permease protein n=1 Tax=Lampropedia puyangensis TaxID=1330072 RepID=A0A4S8F6H5_9BURK|nr:TRAP transporter small permease [Lampropedia puyangensis]THU02501.1 TRAP transporter small permease [Lampropedia puyangensis]